MTPAQQLAIVLMGFTHHKLVGPGGIRYIQVPTGVLDVNEMDQLFDMGLNSAYCGSGLYQLWPR